MYKNATQYTLLHKYKKQLRGTLPYPAQHYMDKPLLVTEIAVIKAFETFAVTCLVLGHLVNRIVNGIEILLLGNARKVHLAFACAVLGIHALVEVGLGIPYNLAYELCKLGCMLGLLPCVTLEGLGNFGITLTVCLTAHRKVHAHLGALAHEVVLKTLPEFGIRTFAITEFVLGNEIELAAVLYNLNELVLLCFAYRALIGCLGTFVDISTYGTTPFFCHNIILF